MRRIVSMTLMLMVGAALAIASIGCGADEERSRVPQSRLKSTGLPENPTPDQLAAHKAERERLLSEVMIWPEEQGPPRDREADTLACQEEMNADPNLRQTNALVKLTWVTRCMEDKGWALNPDVQLNRR
jgi:hypothetical protein